MIHIRRQEKREIKRRLSLRVAERPQRREIIQRGIVNEDEFVSVFL